MGPRIQGSGRVSMPSVYPPAFRFSPVRIRTAGNARPVRLRSDSAPSPDPRHSRRTAGALSWPPRASRRAQFCRTHRHQPLAQQIFGQRAAQHLFEIVAQTDPDAQHKRRLRSGLRDHRNRQHRRSHHRQVVRFPPATDSARPPSIPTTTEKITNAVSLVSPYHHVRKRTIEECAHQAESARATLSTG